MPALRSEVEALGLLRITVWKPQLLKAVGCCWLLLLRAG